MTIVVDIECPECGRSRPVQKDGIATYRCIDCDRVFGREDVAP